MELYKDKLGLFIYPKKKNFSTPYAGDNSFETMSSCYVHCKATGLKLGSMEGFTGDFIILLELYPEFCVVVQFSGVGVCDPPERHN